MKRITKKFLQLFLTGLTFLFLFFSGTSAYAVTELTEDIDLSNLQLYQFTLTQANMEVVSQNAAVERLYIPANGQWKESTVFAVRVNKNLAYNHFDHPLILRFKNAGVVNGKVVNVKVTLRRVDAYLTQKNEDYVNPHKTVVPFLTVDENWGTKSIQIMDFIYPNHPTITHNMHGVYSLDTHVTAELEYQDGSPVDLKMVMRPSDIDVKGASGRNETFSLYNIDTTTNKIIKNINNVLEQTTVNDRTTWSPNGITNLPWEEYNKSGFAVRSSTNTMAFSYTTTAVCGGLFGFYVETPEPPKKQASTDTISALVGQNINYTSNYKIPTPGKDVIGSLSSMKMIEVLDDRLDFQDLTVQFDGRILTQGSDYSVEQFGQKLIVTIAPNYIVRNNAGKEVTVIYRTKTNDKILANREIIENQVTQEIDNISLSSNVVTTEVRYKKTHSFISGTNGKELPPEVLELLPPEQTNLANGTTVAPDPPIGNKTQVSVAEGNWIFQSYDKPSETIQDQDVHFIGTWIFQEYEKPTKEVLNNNGTNIDNQEVKSGDVLTYKITYKNTTDRDQDVVITDELPKNTEYVNGSTVYDGFSKRKLTWRRSVAKDETVVVTFKVRVNEGIDGEVLENSARIGNNFYSMDTNTTKNPTPFKKYVLPDTGGKGRMFYILSGSLITGFAAILMFYRYRIKYASSDL